MPQITPEQVDSSTLQQTVVVPALRCPIPEHQNVIWCSSFELAWKQIPSSIRIEGAEDILGFLNESEVSAADVEPDSYYTAAGPCTKDTVEKIHQDLNEKFSSPEPSSLLESLTDEPDLLVVYAYLTASVLFDHPFMDLPENIVFTDSVGKIRSVRGFGVLRERGATMGFALPQVSILHQDADKGEFVLDLSRETQPYQLVVAKIPHLQTLADTLEDVTRRVSTYQDKTILLPGNSLSVPNMNFNIGHRFRELEADPIAEASQRTTFQLNRFGATLESEAELKLLGIPEGEYLLDGPFLIQMKKRAAPRPCFVMWVDNVELMSEVL
jgi:hypothetical protein